MATTTGAKVETPEALPPFAADAPAGWLPRGLAVALLFLGVADAVTTEATLQLGGATEENPLICWLRCELGEAWILPKMAGHGVLATLVVLQPSASMLVAMSVLTAILVAVTGSNYALLADAVGAYTFQAATALL